ncbi:MAG: F0F1 ATP synthase subunit epsilon [Acidobacteria bacterium]|nr:F0F1 ATP synthase subunit epsilon [Acidobacteriota bacterium]
MTLQVELVSPERILWSGEADMVIARTIDGEIAFLSNHAPFIGALGIGRVQINLPDGGVVRAAVHGGFVEVSNNKVTVLSDVAELSGDIDVARAQEALRRAETSAQSDANAEELGAAKLRAELRIAIATAA